MKIALVNDYPEGYGAETIIQTLAHELGKNEDEVRVYCAAEYPDIPSTIDFTQAPSSSLRKKVVDKSILHWFIKKFREDKPSVVHTHNLGRLTFAPVVAAQKLGIQAIHSHHDYRSICPTQMLIDQLRAGKNCESMNHCLRCVLSSSKRYPYLKSFSSLGEGLYTHRRRREVISILEGAVNTAPSKGMVKILAKHGLDVRTVPNGVTLLDGEEIIPKDIVKKVLKLNDDKLLVGHFGALAAHKGISQLNAAIHMLSKELALFVFTSGRFGNFAFEKEKVRLFGRLPRLLQLSLMNACDLVIACSVWNEPFNLTVTEAMCYGKPIVASDVAGHREQLVPNESGILYSPNNVQALVEGLMMLLQDASMREHLGSNAKSRYQEKFTGSAMAERYRRLYAD